MALPGGLTTVTITGTYTSASGAAASGSVSFAPTSAVTDAAGTTILTEIPVTAALGTAGSFSLGPIPCTDNAGLVPIGWAYQVSVAVGGATQTITPVFIPHALGSTVDMSQIGPGPITSPVNGVYYLPNASPVPAAAPSAGGGFLYANNGHLYWFGVSGTAVQIA